MLFNHLTFHSVLCLLVLLAPATADPTVNHTEPSNLTFLVTFPTTYVRNSFAKTQWTASPTNQNPISLYLMDYTGQEVRQTCCESVAYTDTNSMSCTWMPDSLIYPNDNYKLMLNQTGSGNYTQGDVTILAAGTTALVTYSSSQATSSASASTSATAQNYSTAPSLTAGAIAGVVVGAVVAGALFVTIIACILLRRRRTNIRNARMEAAKPVKFEAPDGVVATASPGSTWSATMVDSTCGSLPENGAASSETARGETAEGHGYPEDVKTDNHGLVEAPLNERPAEMMDQASQPVFELEAIEVPQELSAHRRFSFD